MLLVSSLLQVCAALLVLATLPAVVELIVLTIAGGGSSRPRPRRWSPPRRCEVLAVVVPAHDEEARIARCAASLLACQVEGFALRVVVVADDCRDATAERARAAGAEVWVRSDAARRGRGNALEPSFARLLTQGADAIAVVEADCVVEPSFAREIVRRIRAGADAVQVRYELSSSQISTGARLAAIAWNALNRLRPRGRARLGLSCGILGSGFAVARETLLEVSYRARSLEGDLEYHLALVQAGRSVEYCDATAVRAEEHTSAARSRTARWKDGRLRLAGAALPRLALRALGGRLGVLEPALDLATPPLALLAAAALLELAAPLPVTRIWGAATLAVLALHVTTSMVLSGARSRDWAALLLAPGYAAGRLARLAAPARGRARGPAPARAPREGAAPQETSAGGSFKIAYLVDRYPATRHAWIAREIRGLEACGLEVERFTIRAANEPADPRDAEERRRTRAVVQPGLSGALATAGAVAALAFTRPKRFARSIRAAASMGAGSRGGLALHFLRLAQACVLARLLGRCGASHLHAHVAADAATLAALCSLLGGPPFSFAVHGPELGPLAGSREIRAKIRLARFAVAISHHGRSRLYREAAPEQGAKIHLVRCGADETLLESPAERPSGAAHLVCVARLDSDGGHLVLLEAARRLVDDGLAIEVALVGDGPLRGAIERRIRELDLSERVRVLGWLGGNGVRAEILASRALVRPSLEEGPPSAILEALALRRPVIATFVGGVPELVFPSFNGWLAAAGSVDDLAQAMREALTAGTEALEAAGENGARLVAEQHDSRAEAAKLARLFRGEGLPEADHQAAKPAPPAGKRPKRRRRAA